MPPQPSVYTTLQIEYNYKRLGSMAQYITLYILYLHILVRSIRFFWYLLPSLVCSTFSHSTYLWYTTSSAFDGKQYISIVSHIGLCTLHCPMETCIDHNDHTIDYLWPILDTLCTLARKKYYYNMLTVLIC